ncbi:MAG: ABC transporter permease [Chloroflexota bacterium]
MHPVSQQRFRAGRQLLKNPKFVAGSILIGTIAVCAILAPLIARYAPDALHIDVRNQDPSGAHWLGTDNLGRDLWSRLIWGGRTSLPEGIAIVAFSFCIGVPWGIIAGFGSRVLDDLLMRLVDVLLALPGLVLAFCVIAMLGSGARSVIIALGIAGIPGYARVARASTLTAKNLDYVLAARATGAGSMSIMRRHIFRHIIDALVILATLNLSGAILAAAALSYLGVGVQPPAADWGSMLSNGYTYMFQSTAQLIFPAIVIVLCVLGINLMGDSLGEALNLRLHRR